ncbi:hypothetical protein E8E14_008186 [Neopestalotiopsis sp. 37M]|nr:hypothetical protein E8E14_008186 [Neopestalotiopsis sp. 37M]
MSHSHGDLVMPQRLTDSIGQSYDVQKNSITFSPFSEKRGGVAELLALGRHWYWFNIREAWGYMPGRRWFNLLNREPYEETIVNVDLSFGNADLVIETFRGL